MIEGKKQMTKLILALIALTFIACGDTTEEDCSIYDSNYSHTTVRCGLSLKNREPEVVAADIICDPSRTYERDMCIPFHEMPELAPDCGHFNVCWKDINE